MYLKTFVAVAAIASIASAVPNSVFHAQHFTHSEEIAFTYDYVIIGGGTAGLTVADRLTEDGNCRRIPFLIWSRNHSTDICCSYRPRSRVRLLRTKYQF
jgi:hypothetical protein